MPVSGISSTIEQIRTSIRKVSTSGFVFCWTFSDKKINDHFGSNTEAFPQPLAAYLKVFIGIKQFLQ